MNRLNDRWRILLGKSTVFKASKCRSSEFRSRDTNAKSAKNEVSSIKLEPMKQF
jgi:hypothetical protein